MHLNFEFLFDPAEYIFSCGGQIASLYLLHKQKSFRMLMRLYCNLSLMSLQIFSLPRNLINQLNSYNNNIPSRFPQVGPCWTVDLQNVSTHAFVAITYLSRWPNDICLYLLSYSALKVKSAKCTKSCPAVKQNPWFSVSRSGKWRNFL